MRRGLAGFILGLSLVVASVSWAGFVTNRTVLDPGRSERLADQVLENQVLRAALVVRLTDALSSAVPGDVPIPNNILAGAADTALEDARVEALIRDGIVRTHQNALNGVSEPVTIDAAALGQASRDALVAARPELDGVLPATPSLEVELPTTGLSWLGSLRNFINRVVTITFLLAIAGGVASFVVAKDRAAIMRRVAFWAFGAAAFWLIVGYVIPLLAAKVGPTSTALSAAIIDVMFSAMIRPALYMAGFGVAMLGLSMLIPAKRRRHGARVMQPTRNTAPVQHRTVTTQRPVIRQRPATQQRPTSQPSPSAPRSAPSARIGDPAAARSAEPVAQRDPSNPWAAEAPPTQASGPSSEGIGEHSQGLRQGSTKWVEGIGYIEMEDPSGPDAL